MTTGLRGLAIALAIAAGASGAAAQGPSSTAGQASNPAPGLTLANYHRLQNGMTYREVVAIFGAEGEEQSSIDLGTSQQTNYRWMGPQGLSFALLTFQNGKLTGKIHMGLK
jgi:hypothetical protein